MDVPSAAAKAYHDLVFHEWWTKESGEADKDGTFAVPAFYGKYRVIVNGVSREVDLTRSKGHEVVDFIR